MNREATEFSSTDTAIELRPLDFGSHTGERWHPASEFPAFIPLPFIPLPVTAVPRPDLDQLGPTGTKSDSIRVKN